MNIMFGLPRREASNKNNQGLVPKSPKYVFCFKGLRKTLIENLEWLMIVPFQSISSHFCCPALWIAPLRVISKPPSEANLQKSVPKRSKLFPWYIPRTSQNEAMAITQKYPWKIPSKKRPQFRLGQVEDLVPNHSWSSDLASVPKDSGCTTIHKL